MSPKSWYFDAIRLAYSMLMLFPIKERIVKKHDFTCEESRTCESNMDKNCLKPQPVYKILSMGGFCCSVFRPDPAFFRWDSFPSFRVHV